MLSSGYMDCTAVLTAVIGLGGVWLGGHLATLHLREERRRQFIRDQLDRFYSPLLARREQLRATGELRLTLSAHARRAFQAGEDIEPFKRQIDYNNRQFHEQLAIYKEMVGIFAGNLWLAKPSTRGHFRTLVELVDIWTRFQEQSVPEGVAFELDDRGDTSDARLAPFYEELEAQVDRLRGELEKETGWCSWWGEKKRASR